MTDALTPDAGPLTLVDGPAPQTDVDGPPRRTPAAGVAARLLAQWQDDAGAVADTGPGDMIFLAGSERRADEIARALGAMGGAEGPEVLVFPPWDCLPFDRAAPSRESMGRRMAVLARLADEDSTGRLVITSPEAVMQRTPPPATVSARFVIAAGETLDREQLRAFALRCGYVEDERIDEPGEIAFFGEVIDVYPPASRLPVRILVDQDGTVTEVRAFDPVSQRSEETIAGLVLTAASEQVFEDGDSAAGSPAGSEHRLGEHYADGLGTLFGFAPDARVLMEGVVPERIERFAALVAEAFDSRRSFSDADGTRPPSPERLYLGAEETASAMGQARTLDAAGIAPAPLFALERTPGAALKRYLRSQQAAGRAIVLSGLAHEHRVVARLLKRNGVEVPTALEAWPAPGSLDAGALAVVLADLDGGYEDDQAGWTVLTPTDITGGRLARATSTSENPFGETEIRIGDVVIHEEHGLGVLEALEETEVDGVSHDLLRLAYHGGTTVLAPVEDFGRIWRYGSEPSAVTLDRLNTQAWLKRRAEISAQIDATAGRMVEMARARETARTAPLVPPRADYARFVARFPFPESIDQAAAIDSVLSDLSSGRPMNRLVCGDVGFGKTEVALRATAAVALSGGQVLVAAPTTVLARQHYETFRRRFEGTGVAVAHLSRLVDGPGVAAVRAGLADGSIRVVVGTQALADATLGFADLALVVIDEEHRFGARLKADLSDRAPHLLAMSATPIPRTLQSALVGVQDVSIIASPPSRRRPIRTFLTDFDPGSVRTVLLREKARDGQSFIVAPRIEDLKPLAEQLATLVPELTVAVAHGKLSAETLDGVVTGFAEGEGDILLSTNIIENGLDVPRANTMLIWRPDRFGLAQLHQLRGRVGRGRRQGFAYLLGDPAAPLADSTRARLQTLEALDRLGSGFAISARDLDLRGGGDLVGDEQAGHIRLIGASLYQRVLGRALRAARGEDDPSLSRPRLALPSGGRFAPDYVPDASVRINLYARLAHLNTAEEIDALQDETEDRFGPLPEDTVTLFTTRRLTALAVAAGVTEVVSGPKATAFSFSPAQARHLLDRLALRDDQRWSGDRLLIEANDSAPHDTAFIEGILDELQAAA